MAAISAKELSKAVNSLADAFAMTKRTDFQNTDIQRVLRDACIQRFEYSVELSWKTSMKMLGSMTSSPKLATREMARNNLIDNPDIWLEFIDARNETSHAYDEDIADRIFEHVQRFLPEANKLILRLSLIK